MIKRLVITPHADDCTIFIGGIIKQWSNAGDEVIIVRVTDDNFDSVGLTEEETVKRIRQEAEEAYLALGAKETVHMGYRSDYLCSCDYCKLRGEFIELIRKYRPYSVVSPDLDIRGEDNSDHKVVALAVAEALWQASFDKHNPESIQKGFLPYSVPNRMNYNRNYESGYTAVDISDVITDKACALAKHVTPISHILSEQKMRAKAAGFSFEIGGEENYEGLIAELCKKLANGIGSNFGLTYAELIKDQGKGLLEMFI